jgi:glutamine synthetase
VAPRSILRRQTEAARQAGFAAFAATELEHYLFRTSYRDAAQQDFRNLEPAGWYLEDYHILQGTRTEGFHAAARRHLKLSGVPVETSKGEWGRGQHELNIRYAEALDDGRPQRGLQAVPEGARRGRRHERHLHGQVRADGAGSSCHIHLSLWRDGKNAFSEGMDGPLQDTFLGGWLAHVPELMVFYAPTVNSYKRYVDASWAPTRLAWSYDNRTAGFRVVGDGAGLRIECRIPGADCNAYLALAAALASGLDGIANRIEPPECFVGDVYAAKALPRVPYTLPRQWTHSKRAHSPSAPSARTWSSTTLTSIARRRLPSTRQSPTGSAGDISSAYETQRQSALITGAGSGIGRQSALLFSREGAAVSAVDVNDRRRRKRCNS